MLHKIKVKLSICLALLLCVGLTAGYVAGYHQAIGVYPFTPKTTVMPPATAMIGQTFEDVGSFIAEDITNKEPYQEGMNCVDYALVVARNAQWKGLEADVIRLDFVTGASHAMLLFVTADQGYIFLDPQTDMVFDVMKVGQLYDSREITGVYILMFVWTPLDEYFAQGEKDNE